MPRSGRPVRILAEEQQWPEAVMAVRYSGVLAAAVAVAADDEEQEQLDLTRFWEEQKLRRLEQPMELSLGVVKAGK